METNKKYFPFQYKILYFCFDFYYYEMWVGKINIIMQICFEKMEINKGYVISCCWQTTIFTDDWIL